MKSLLSAGTRISGFLIEFTFAGLKHEGKCNFLGVFSCFFSSWISFSTWSGHISASLGFYRFRKIISEFGTLFYFKNSRTMRPVCCMKMRIHPVF